MSQKERVDLRRQGHRNPQVELLPQVSEKGGK